MRLKQDVKALGTNCRFWINSDQADRLMTKAITLLHHYETIFSAHSPTSSLNQVNVAAGQNPVIVPAELFNLIEIGQAESLKQPSQLNITIGPLTQAWHIGFSDATEPEQTTIDHLLTLCQPKNIQLNKEEHTVYLTQPNMSIDLGALAKGYIADLILTALKQAGATDVLLDFGGNILAQGVSPRHKPFQIGIRNPFSSRGQSIGHIALTNQALVTSGTYERFLIKDGKAFHHILDQKTGRPLETDMVSLTIMAPTALDGEIWTSKLFGLATEEALAIINQTDHIEGIIMTKDKHQFLSHGFKDAFTPSY